MNYCWCTINVADMESSIRFNSEFVGLSLKSRFSPRPGMDIVFMEDEHGMEIELIRPPAQTAESNRKDISVGFEVTSLREALQIASDMGIPVAEGPFDTPSVRFFFVEDPDGTRIQIVEKISSKQEAE